MNKQGGNVGAVIFFGIGFVAFIAGAVLYLVSDDKTSKKWAEQTKGIVTLNENLVAENKKLVTLLTDINEDHNALTKTLEEQKNKIDKLEFTLLMPPKTVAMPTTVNFRVLKTQVVSQDAKPTAKKSSVQLSEPQRKQLIKKVKKQVRELSQ
jgi:hypothetical protein